MSHKHEDRVRIGISIGDINGIGPEVVMKALIDQRLYEQHVPIIYASSKLLTFYKKALNLNDFSFSPIKEAAEAQAKRVNLITAWEEDPFIKPGEVNEDGGKFAFKSLKMAVEDLASNKIDVLITAPINKKNIQSAEFQFPGHTEYLANYANVENPLMIMVADSLRVGLVSGHISIKEVAASITKERIIDKLSTFNKALIQDFGISRPKLAVLGLNPHSGDNGLLGSEERDIIEPAIRAAKAQGIIALGPYSADGFFGSSAFTKYDGILAMYHDQGLSPFKAISFDTGVNFTAGLPIVRTAPDHGTAHDIAGKGVASENSIRQAIYLACDVYHARKTHRIISANPLQASKGDGDGRDN